MGKDQIGVLIIESDTLVQRQIAQLFQTNPLVSFVEIAVDTDEALLKIIDLNPDLVFLEYPVKGKTGAGIIKFIQSKLPSSTIVFVSESKGYAAEAIRHEIYHYLLNPIVKTELVRILEKAHIKKQSNLESRINEIIENKKEETRLRFNTTKGLSIINPSEIVYCKADGSYTELCFANGSVELAIIPLLKIEEILVLYNFVRISRSVVINKDYIRKIYLKGNILILSANGVEYKINGSRLPVRALNKIYLE